MATNVGTIPVNLHTVDRDETVYALGGNTVSHTDMVALRRTLPVNKGNNTMRTQIRFERGFVADASLVEKPVTVSIAVTVPPGVVPADVKTYVSMALTEAATLAGEVAVTGDIHL